MDARPTTRETSSVEPTSPRASWPRHIAIIMDGNGRWAQERGQQRIMGHQAGAQSVRKIVEHCRTLGVEALTLFSFSSENWKRPEAEVDALMVLCREHLISERAHMIENGIRLRWIGRPDGLPDVVIEELRRSEEATAHCRGMTLVLAINYGGRAEIVDAIRSIARDTAAGTLQPDEIDEELVNSRLYTAGLPDPDLLIRTAGECRISNYLLWQISYSELYVTDQPWPEFDVPSLNEAIDAYASRNRRFGGVDIDTDPPSGSDH